MEFSVERKFFKLFGATIRTFSPDRQLVCRAEQKAFKLKEHVVFYGDEDMTQHLFSIKARKILDLGVTYDIFAPDETTILASLRRKGLKSALVQDEWLVLDANGNEVAMVSEDSGTLGILRRYVELVALFLPQRFVLTMNGQPTGSIQQNRNPFTVRLACNFDQPAVKTLSETVIYAIPNMLAVIEQRQN